MGKFRVLEAICASIIILSFGTAGSDAVPALQQTVPPGDVAVCLLSTVQYTCVAQTRMSWRESGSSVTTTYALHPASRINDTGMAGAFTTVLTDISGSILTSTATIDSVNLTDNGRNISCFDINGATNKLVQIEGVPLIPINLNITAVLSRGDDTLTVNLTWFLNESHCVVVYYVEVTTINISHITNMTTTSQHITLILQIGVVYSFRVRGADNVNRIGEWSDSFIYPSTPDSPSNLNITVLSSGDNLLSVNLTWSQENSDYVVMYYVEVTATNINTTNMTMSQHITLILQIGVVYSFRVRGADSINRLGEWSDYFVYPSTLPAPSNLTAIVLSKGDNTLTINLTWFQDNSHYVVVFYVEVNATDISITNMTTISQHITLILQIGVVYSFRVRGADSIDRGQWSDYFIYPICAPPAPSNLTSTVLSRGENALSVNLTWSQDNSRYVVVYDVEVTATNINITNMTTSQYIVLPLQIGVVFSFRVRGADSINRLGEWSNSVLYPGALPTPSNLTITVLSTDYSKLTVNLTWSQNGSRYVVIYHVEVTATNITSITNMTTTSQYIVLPLQIGVVYSFRVRGADSINRLGEWSDSVIYPSASPEASSNLTANILDREDSTLSVNLTWFQGNSRYVVVYYVEVTATNINITNMTTSQYIVLPLQIGVVYSFRVRGADSINRLGEWSDYFIYPSVPLAPVNLTAFVLSKEDNTVTVNLTWSQENSDYVVMYYIEVTATNINFTNMTTSQYITVRLQIGVKYSFRVRGADSINRLGKWSDCFIYPRGAPPAPSNLTITKLSSGDSILTVNLTWSQQNSRYVVMYYVEVNAINISITNLTTTSQYIVLTLQIGVVYSFRVRGADSINRLGEWSDYLNYSAIITSSGFSDWDVIIVVLTALIVIFGIGIIVAVILKCQRKRGNVAVNAGELQPLLDNDPPEPARNLATQQPAAKNPLVPAANLPGPAENPLEQDENPPEQEENPPPENPPQEQDENPPPEQDENPPPVQDENPPPVQDENLPPVQDENRPPVQEENLPPVQDENLPPVQDENPPPVQDENPPPVQDENLPPVQDENPPPVQDENPSEQDERHPDDPAVNQ